MRSRSKFGCLVYAVAQARAGGKVCGLIGFGALVGASVPPLSSAEARAMIDTAVPSSCCVTQAPAPRHTRLAQAATGVSSDAAPAAVADANAAASDAKAATYELPSVIVKMPVKPAVATAPPKPKKATPPTVTEAPAAPPPKPKPATVQKKPAAPKPSTAQAPASTTAAAGNAANSAAGSAASSVDIGVVGEPAGGAGSGAPAGIGPAIGNAGFSSSRVVEQVGTVDQVTAEQIERGGARTLDQAIRLMPGVNVRNGGDGVPRIDIRGMRTRNVILLVDGVPMNATFDGQFDPRSIPVENIARIQVTRGGSSVLYGPGGNAAVIDIITKGAAPGLHATFDAGVGFGKDKDARVTASYGSDALKTFISASIYKRDEYHLSDDFRFSTLQTNDARVNSDREDRAFYANTEAKLSEAVSWGVSINYREGEYGKPPSTANAFNNSGVCRNPGTNAAQPFNWGPCSDFASGLRFERVDDYNALSLQSSGRINLGGGLMLRPMAYFNGLNELTNRFDDKDYANQLLNGASREDASTKIYGGGGQVIYQVDANNLLTVALDAHREGWEADGFQRASITVSRATGSGCTNLATCRTALRAICESAPNSGTFSNNSVVIAGGRATGSCANVSNTISTDRDVDVYSAAAEYEVKLTSQLSAVFGAGWAEQRREATSDNDYTYLAGVRYAVTDDTAVRANVARKIRFPTLRNLFGIDEGNASLETEVTQNYEVGFDQRFRAIDGLFSVSLFRINAENFIRKGTCDGQINVFCNFDSLRFQGVETSFAFSPVDNLKLQVGYTFLDAKNLAPGVGNTDTLDNEPRHKFMAAASYRFATGTSFNVDYQFVAGSYAVSRDLIQTLRLTDYHLLNLGLTHDINGGALQLYGRIENVLDENYETSFGFPEAGRTFYIGARAKL